MIVEYESVKDHIMRLIEASEAGGRRIKYIVLNGVEYDELFSDDKDAPKYDENAMMGTYLGITIVGFKWYTQQKKEKIRRRYDG